MKHCFLLLFSFVVISHSDAQKKALSYEQVFKNAPTNLYKNLPSFVQWVDDEHVVLSERNGSVSNEYVIDVKTGEKKPFVKEAKVESTNATPKSAVNVSASPDKKYFAFTRKNNLFIGVANDGTEQQLTFDGNDSVMNGYASWVYYEEILGRASRNKAFWWSNDSKYIAFMHFDDSEVPVFPIYVANGQQGYLEKQRYPKAGNKNPKVKIGIVQVETGKITWADFNENEDQYFGMPNFTPDNQLFVQWMNRGQDNLIIYNVNVQNGSKKEIYNEKQSTWIDLDDNDRITFLSNKKQFILKSDYKGWYQYYLHDMNGKLINAITDGAFTVGDLLKVDEVGKKIYFTARKENSARWDVYTATLDGKSLTRLTFGDYSFSNVQLSPNNKYFIAGYSNIGVPSTLAIIDMNGKVIREIANLKGTAFNEINLPEKKLVRVKSDDGLFDLPLTITYPINFDPQKKYPVLMSVYGGPNAGRVYDVWNTSATEIWWAQEGLIQVSADNRSSGHFGKNGMNYIHRQLGIYEIEDFMAIGKWLKQQPWVDTAKLCITGGSFGGYMTCMALTYGSSVFNYGIANSSVTDWQLYDTHYTERYMDTPAENAEGYAKTNVMNYVSRYKGLLRVVHGTSDDNVHQQNSIQLINKMQDAGKHFELMMYPGERHGIGGLKGVHNRTEAYLFYYKNLLQKPAPSNFFN